MLVASGDTHKPFPPFDNRRSRPSRDETQRARRESSVEGFLATVASRDHSQGRLSVALLTASCCAAQLEAQSREAQYFRKQAPGPCDIQPLIADLQRTRTRLCALIYVALDMETASSVTLVLPDSRFAERFRKQVAAEKMLTDFVAVGVKAAALIVSLSRLARQAGRLRSE